jgi:hypothetical protein
MSDYKHIEFPKVKYHPKHEPRTVQNAEEEKALGRGWVNSPNDLPKPLPIWNTLRSVKPWWEEWKWFFGAIALILGIVIAAMKISGH